MQTETPDTVTPFHPVLIVAHADLPPVRPVYDRDLYGYVAYAPDFPGREFYGATPETVVQRITEARAARLRTLRANPELAPLMLEGVDADLAAAIQRTAAA